MTTVECPSCTYLNTLSFGQCAMCGQPLIVEQEEQASESESSSQPARAGLNAVLVGATTHAALVQDSSSDMDESVKAIAAGASTQTPNKAVALGSLIETKALANFPMQVSPATSSPDRTKKDAPPGEQHQSERAKSEEGQTSHQKPQEVSDVVTDPTQVSTLQDELLAQSLQREEDGLGLYDETLARLLHPDTSDEDEEVAKATQLRGEKFLPISSSSSRRSKEKRKRRSPNHPSNKSGQLMRQMQKDEEMMMQTMMTATSGRSWKFVQEVLKLYSELLKSHIDMSNISMIEVDDIVFLAEQFHLCQAYLRKCRRPSSVSCGYIYTQQFNLDFLRNNGLVTRTGNRIRNYYGDGVYVGQGPTTLRHMGDVGLLVAMLIGREQLVDLSPPPHPREVDTYVASQNNEPSDQLVLKRSAQCLPVFSFHRDAEVESISEVQSELRTLVDKFFNEDEEESPRPPPKVIVPKEPDREAR